MIISPTLYLSNCYDVNAFYFSGDENEHWSDVACSVSHHERIRLGEITFDMERDTCIALVSS